MSAVCSSQEELRNITAGLVGFPPPPLPFLLFFCFSVALFFETEAPNEKKAVGCSLPLFLCFWFSPVTGVTKIYAIFPLSFFCCYLKSGAGVGDKKRKSAAGVPLLSFCNLLFLFLLLFLKEGGDRKIKRKEAAKGLFPHLFLWHFFVCLP